MDLALHNLSYSAYFAVQPQLKLYTDLNEFKQEVQWWFWAKKLKHYRHTGIIGVVSFSRERGKMWEGWLYDGFKGWRQNKCIA